MVMYVLVKILLWIYLQIYSHSLLRLIPDGDIFCFIGGSIYTVCGPKPPIYKFTHNLTL